MSGLDLDFSRRNPHGHAGHLGIRYVAHGDDWADMAIDHDARLVADAASGIFASGPIIALMDSATGLACMAKRGALVGMATLDLRIDYLRPGPPGRTVFGHGECYRITRHIAFARGYAHVGDPDDPVAHVAATFMFLGEKPAA
ncbi:MAG: PaaI family thioesterase [Sphingomonas sp.]